MKVSKIKEFHEKVIGLKFPTKASFPKNQDAILCDRLITEELSEYFKAKAKGELVEIADALGDLIVVIAQTAFFYGFDIDAILKEIHKSNMSKKDGKRDSGGKFIKPDTWKAPDLFPILFPSLVPMKETIEGIFKDYTTDVNINDFLDKLRKGALKEAYDAIHKWENLIIEKHSKKADVWAINLTQALQKEFALIIKNVDENDVDLYVSEYMNAVNTLEVFLSTMRMNFLRFDKNE